MGLSLERDRYFSQLMVQAQSGDKRAYNELLRSVSDLLRGYLQRRMGTSADLEDVLQEILLSVHGARHTYQSDRAFGPWVYAIARFRLCDYWRKCYRQLRHKHVELEAQDVELPETADKNMELPEKLAAALNRMPNKQKEIVNLLKIQGLSIQSAAKRLNMSISAVKVAAHRAYKVLKYEYETESNENI